MMMEESSYNSNAKQQLNYDSKGIIIITIAEGG